MTDMVQERSGQDEARRAIQKLFDDTRRRLVETGTRNRLVHVNRANARGNVLNIFNANSDAVYSMLSGGRLAQFLPTRFDKINASKDDAVDPATLPRLEDGDVDASLQTRHQPEALQKKLLKIAREAQTAEEESGVNILYLALGFLTWFEDETSQVTREAPLVLLPVELVRNARTSTYDLRRRQDDLLTNLPLQQRLHDDFGIELPELEIDEAWLPSDYFAEVSAATVSRNRWKIEPDAIHLGFFSFSKLLMYRDLAIDTWPDGAIATHELTRGILYEGFEPEEPSVRPEDRLDDVLPPEKLFHVVDADASQATVIEEARRGRNLVVQGPPGTGKSQTITNIIAAAASEGKRVLFLAEKMAALSVVHERLVKSGLRDVCLELHSKTANKKSTLGEIARTLSQARAAPVVPGPPSALREARDRLNALTNLLHRQIGMSGETPYTVLGRQSLFIGAGCPPPSLDSDVLCVWSREQEASLVAVLRAYGELCAEELKESPHPFQGARNLDLQPVDLMRLKASATEARQSVAALAEAVRGAFAPLGISEPATLERAGALSDTLDRLQGSPANSKAVAQSMFSSPERNRLEDILRTGASWREARDKAAQWAVDAAFEVSVAPLRSPIAAGVNSFFVRWGRRYRKASRELAGLSRDRLPKRAAERLQLVDDLVGVARLKSEWESGSDACARDLGGAWRGDKTDFATLLAIATWCGRVSSAPISIPQANAIELASRGDVLGSLRAALATTLSTSDARLDAIGGLLNLDGAAFGERHLEATDLDALAGRFGAMSDAPNRYIAWTSLARLRRELETAGLSALEQRVRSGELDAQAAVIELQYARAEKLWKLALSKVPELRDLAFEKRHDLVIAFARLERQRLKDNSTDILARHFAQMPQGAEGEMKVLRGEIGKRRGHIALRKLFERAGTAIQRIKPVLLMSPISVAQFLPPGTVSFDLLVIDEASQVRPEDALGAIARAGQIVVVGDNKQLPPSSFFDRLLADDDDEGDGDDETGIDLLAGAAKIGSLESILSLCEARGLSGRILKWHYRSRDPSLIMVSNAEFYDHGLVLPPSPLQKDPAYGLSFTRVDGVYDRGGRRDNRIEGEAIVKRVARHARETPSHSLGIVTFSFAQRNLITELLDASRRQDAVLDAFLREGNKEDFFVKNIENVQGDERDVILISVGYGPSAGGGRLNAMSFGPVNGEGGERRLNVLFTRARVRCEVFASFDPEDIDLSRTAAAGPRILKRFLDFAKSGRLEESAPTGEDADSPFEEDVANVIRNYGFLADPQVGSSGFRIDLGVRHPDKPGAYLLAVECDGATYHGALWARERDRLRQDVLEHLGWRFHRIWSTDWFYNRLAEIERLRSVLFETRQLSEHGLKIDGANIARSTPPEPEVPEPLDFELPAPVTRQAPSYRRAEFPLRHASEPHEAPISILADLTQRIVAAEGPIHIEEIARRVAASFGREKAGSRIVAATRNALAKAQVGSADLVTDGVFWYTRDQAAAPPVRDRSAESGATLKAGNISLLEIKAALSAAREDNAAGSDAELVRSVARLLGFQRVGAELQSRIAEGL